MAIVPSGRVRLMQAQTLQKTENPVGPDATQTEFKSGPAQGQTPPPNNAGGNSPIANLQDVMKQQGQQAKPAVPDSAALRNAVQPADGQQQGIDEQKTEAKSQKWKEAAFDAMSSLGIDKEVIDIIRNNPELYHTEYNNQAKVVTGYFYVPGRFDPSDVARVFDPVAAKMGYIVTKITQEIVKGDYGPKAYQKVMFETKPVQAAGIDPNMDFAEFMGGDQKGRSVGQPTAKAASTQSEMIKQSKNDLLEQLLKIGLEKR